MQASGALAQIPVAHLVLSLEVGGLEMLVARMSLHMRSRGYRPSVICLDSKGALASRLEAEGIDVHCLQRRPGMLDAAALRRLVRMLRQRAVRVLHTHNLEAHLYGNLAGWLAGVKHRIHTQHGIPEGFRGRRRLAARLCGRLSERVTAVSDEVNRFMTDSGWFAAERVQTVLNGIDIESFAPDRLCRERVRATLGIAADAPVFINVARLAPVKDQATLVSAFSQVVAARPDAVLLIAGGGVLEAELHRQIADAGLGDHVRMLGEVAEVRELLAASDFFVLTSLSEGISVSLLEAMAGGLIPVATAVGGNVQIICDQENGYLVAPGDRDGIGRRLLALATGPRPQALASAARRTVMEDFSMERMIEAYDRLYRAMAGARA